MAHHNGTDCRTWPCNPGPTPGHHPPPRYDYDDDGMTSEARADVQEPTNPPDRKAP